MRSLRNCRHARNRWCREVVVIVVVIKTVSCVLRCLSGFIGGLSRRFPCFSSGVERLLSRLAGGVRRLLPRLVLGFAGSVASFSGGLQAFFTSFVAGLLSFYACLFRCVASFFAGTLGLHAGKLSIVAGSFGAFAGLLLFGGRTRAAAMSVIDRAAFFVRDPNRTVFVPSGNANRRAKQQCTHHDSGIDQAIRHSSPLCTT